MTDPGGKHEPLLHTKKERLIRKRNRPKGPPQLWCVVKEKATGKIITQALGKAIKNGTSESRARSNALIKLKAKVGKFRLKDYELSYRYAGKPT